MFQIGQAVLGKYQFKDGSFPGSKRPYLIVDINESEIGMLCVSTVQDKYEKLLWRTNHTLLRYDPPFWKPSFVKLDSLIYCDIEKVGNVGKLLAGGKVLNKADLNIILSRYKEFSDW